MEYATIAGNYYLVTSKNGGTVTDASGTLSKPIAAGDQITVGAPSDKLLCDDEETIIRRSNFKRAALALGLLGGGESSGLPAGYTRLEYLESTGTQWINSECYPFAYLGSINNFGGKVKCQFPRLVTWAPSAESWILSEGIQNSFSTIGIQIRGILYSSFGTSSYKMTDIDELLEVASELNFLNSRKFIAKSVQGYVEETIEEQYNNFEASKPIIVFGTNSHSSVGGRVVKIWSIAFSEKNKIVRDYTPALDQTGTPCMFDTVTRTPFYNSGTGDFLYPGKEETATTYSLRRPRMYAQMTEHGIRRLYHVPKGYNGTPEEYAAENGFKLLVETEQPAEGYWAPVWHEREDCIELEWVETEPPTEQELLTETE